MLEQLQDIYSQMRIALGTIRTVSDAASHLQDRIQFAARRADLPGARVVRGEADDTSAIPSGRP